MKLITTVLTQELEERTIRVNAAHKRTGYGGGGGGGGGYGGHRGGGGEWKIT